MGVWTIGLKAFSSQNIWHIKNNIAYLIGGDIELNNCLEWIENLLHIVG